MQLSEGFRGKVLVFGGMVNPRTYHSDLWLFDSVALKWKLITPAGSTPSPRFSFTLTPLCLPGSSQPSHVLLVGGCSPLPKNDVFLLCLDTMEWSTCNVPFPSLQPPPMLTRHTTSLHDEVIHIIGGGALCFSFGPHFNGRLALYVPPLLKAVDE